MSNDEPIVTNVVRCGICGGPADRYPNRFECQTNTCHMADLNTGLFSDLGFPEEPPLTRWERFRGFLRWLWSCRRTFVWYGNWGLTFLGSSSFARSTVSIWGPYYLWYERWFGPIFKAVTPPENKYGIKIL